MRGQVFLDTCIFFSVVNNPSDRYTLQHFQNIGVSFYSSLPVFGEFIAEIAVKKDKDTFIRTFLSILEELDVTGLVPNPRVSYACYLLCRHNEDERMKHQHTDLVHLGYAMAYEIPLFLTSDKNLTRYRLPSHLTDKGYQKPQMIDLATAKKEFLTKK